MIPASLQKANVRYFRHDDCDAYIALERDPIARKFMRGASTKETSELRAHVMQYSPRQDFLAISDTANDAYIGRCGIFESGEIYVMLSPAYHRSGIGSEVVTFLVRKAKTMGLSPHGLVDPQNAASIRMLERLGWKREGVHKTSDPSDWQNAHLRYRAP